MTEQNTAGISELRDVIDGAQVIARETATVYTPLSNYPNKLSPIKSVEKCLLADGREVHQCNAEENPCNYWAIKAESVRAHLRKHAEQTKAEIEQIKQERDRVLQEQRAAFERRSNGAKKAWLKRRETTDTGMTVEEVKDVLGKFQKQISEISSAQDLIRQAAASVLDATNQLHDEIIDLMTAKMAGATPDPELVKKAEAFETMQSLFSK